jgi:hypothetical protein
MKDEIKGWVEFEGKRFWLDISEYAWIFRELMPNGSLVPASKYLFMDVLFYGKRLDDLEIKSK